MASWKRASGIADVAPQATSPPVAAELNGTHGGGGEKGKGPGELTSVELSPTRSEREAAKADPCVHCRRRKVVLDREAGLSGCATRACPAYVGPVTKKARPEGEAEKVANEEEDSSDESPLLSTDNSRQSSSNVSMDGDVGRRKRQREHGGDDDDGSEDEDEVGDEHCHSQATFSRMVASELRNQTVKNRLLGAVVLTALFATAEFGAGWQVQLLTASVQKTEDGFFFMSFCPRIVPGT